MVMGQVMVVVLCRMLRKVLVVALGKMTRRVPVVGMKFFLLKMLLEFEVLVPLCCSSG